MPPDKAIVLLSGGLDSATTLAIAIKEGYECRCMTFRYGQRHSLEVEAAERVADAFGVKVHRLVDIDLRAFGGSALTADIDVPKDRSEADMIVEIPITYVPARNTIFLAFALGWAEVLEVDDIFIGVNAVDYSGYPDCRPEYIEAFREMAACATKAGVEGNPVRIHTPLIDMAKAEIIYAGKKLGVDYALTLSCYDPAPDGRACGRCDSCLLRKRGFETAGIADPTRYA